MDTQAPADIKQQPDTSLKNGDILDPDYLSLALSGNKPHVRETVTVPHPDPEIYDIGFEGIRLYKVATTYISITSPSDTPATDTPRIIDHVRVILRTPAKQLAIKDILPFNNLSECIEKFRTELHDELGEEYGEWVIQTILNQPPWSRSSSVRKHRPLRHTLDDDGNANRFEDECRGWLIYDTVSKEWFAWDINCWTQASEKVMLAARFVGRSVAYEPHGNRSESEKKEYDAHVKYSASYRGIMNMLKLAAPKMACDIMSVSDPRLLACKNGILNTQSGHFTPLWRCDILRMKYPLNYIDAKYTPHKRSKLWIDHINTVMLDNSSKNMTDELREQQRDQLTAYLFRLFGYILYAGNPERKFIFFWGVGTNGKSTTSNILISLLGAQCKCPSMTQMYSADTDKPAPSIADALTKRLAIFYEASTNHGSYISSAAFKEISGEQSTEKFRKMHANNIRIPIYCLPIGVTNELPCFDSGFTKSVLNRLVTVPFRHIFDTETRGIEEQILVEKDGIFSHMVDELKEYLKFGLIEPPDCARTTQNEVILGYDMVQFFTECLGMPDESQVSVDYFISRDELKGRYLSWCLKNEVEVDTRSIRNENGSYSTVLSKTSTNKLMQAVRILKYPESAHWGCRGIYAVVKT